jgi:hypothetical protein
VRQVRRALQEGAHMRGDDLCVVVRVCVCVRVSCRWCRVIGVVCRTSCSDGRGGGLLCCGR